MDYEMYRIVYRTGEDESWIRTCSTPNGLYTRLSNARNARSQIADWSYRRVKNTFPRRQRVIQRLYADGVNALKWYDVDVKLD